jgi:peptidoglycan hydrolase-like protein with peptidoglycan-binding domain
MKKHRQLIALNLVLVLLLSLFPGVAFAAETDAAEPAVQAEQSAAAQTEATAEPEPTPMPTPEPTPDNRAPAYTPASTDYKTLTEKSRGQAVKDLQQRLWDLNYYANKINGVYEDTTAIAVMSFCTQNGLYIQGDATPEMQELLYSSRAEYYREPWIPVMLGPKFRWRVHGDADVAAIYPMIVNRSPSRTVLGVELYYYYTDVWGERYIGSNGTPLLRRATLQKTMKPGDYYSSEQVLVSPYSWINTVYIGINKIVFDDGEIRTADNIQYIGYPMRN